MRLSTVTCLLFIVAAFAVPFFLYQQLPNPMPSHWDLHGKVNGTMSKPWGAFFAPSMTLALWLLLGFLPRAYDSIRTVIVAFMAVVSIIVPLQAAGAHFDMVRVIMGGTGVLLAVIGSLLSKTTRNLWVGIRTPWTLASDEVWLRTHRLGAKVFVIGGILLAFCGLIGAPMPLLLIVLLVPGLVPIVYSYLIYHRLEG